MKRKFVVLLVALTVLISLSACGNVKIEGTPSEVTSEVQSLATDKTATVTVTGYVVLVLEKDEDLDHWCVIVGDEKNSIIYNNTVTCRFDSDPGYVYEGKRVTIKGTVKGSLVFSDLSLSLDNCTMK